MRFSNPLEKSHLEKALQNNKRISHKPHNQQHPFLDKVRLWCLSHEQEHIWVFQFNMWTLDQFMSGQLIESIKNRDKYSINGNRNLH